MHESGHERFPIRKKLGLFLPLVSSIVFGLCHRCLADCIDYETYQPVVGRLATRGFSSSIALSGPIVGSVDAGERGRLILSHPYAYLGGDDLKIIDISTPTSPVVIGGFVLSDRALGVAVQDNYLYVANRLNGLQVLEVTNPAIPRLVGGVDTPGLASDVAVSGRFAYVADSRSGLQIVDISNPLEPVIVGNADTPGVAAGLALSGSLAFIGDYSSGVEVIDIANPTRPISIGFLPLPSAQNIVIDGAYGYVCAGEAGFWIIDISNPRSPELKGNATFPGVPQGTAVGVDILGSYAYVGGHRSGLQIINIANPDDPYLIGSVSISASVSYVAVADSLVYVSNYSGLAIVSRQCSAPTGVVVGSFQASSLAGSIVVEWSISVEHNLLGFEIHRSLQPDRDFVPLNSELIPPATSYSFLDVQVVPGTKYYYRLDAIDEWGHKQIFGPVSAEAAPSPDFRTRLEASRPNPFVGSFVTIPFTLSRAGNVELLIFDITGRQVRSLVNELMPVGYHTTSWNGTTDRGDLVSAGVYVYQLSAPGFDGSRQLIKLR